MFIHSRMLTSCIALACSLANAEQMQKAVDLDPCPCRVNALFGEISGDLDVNLRDLALLGRLWENDAAKEEVGRVRENLLKDIQDNWRTTLQDEVANLNDAGLARTQLLAGEPTRTALLVSNKEVERDKFLKRFGVPSDQKGTTVGPDRIGTTVKVAPNLPTPQYTNLRAFTSPANFSLTERRSYFPNDVFSRLNGGFPEAPPGPSSNPPTTINPNRYNYAVGASGAKVQYISSFEDAIDAFGLDVNVAATYSLFSGSVDLGIDTTTITNERRHTIIATITKSFGWEEASDAVFTDLLTSNFAQDLARAKSDPSFDFESVWGTHLVVAQHLAAELLIRVDFETVSRYDKSEFELDVESSFTSGTNSLDLGVAIRSLKENNKGITNVSVTVDVFGGPDTVEIDGIEVSIPGELASGIASGSNPERVADIINAWDLRLRDLAQGGAVLGAPIDYLYVPLSVLLDEELNPFSAQQNLRLWFLRWLDMESQLLYLQEVIDADNSKFSEPYDYFAYAAQINDPPSSDPAVPGYGNFFTPYEYAADVLARTESRYVALFEKGKRLYSATEDDPEFFLPGDSSFSVPKFELPRPFLTTRNFRVGPKYTGAQAGGSCNAGAAAAQARCNQFTGGPVPGAEFNNQGQFLQCHVQTAFGDLEILNFNLPSTLPRYELKLVYQPLGGIDIYQQPYLVGRNRGMLLSANGIGAWNWNYEFSSNGCGAGNWSNTDGFVLYDYPGLVFYLFDNQTQEIVDFACASGGFCQDEEIAIVLDEINDGKIAPDSTN
jgi:hypothetical protein